MRCGRRCGRGGRRRWLERGVEVVEADLLADAGWAEAAAGCEFVLHAASPLPAKLQAEEAALVAAARGGTLRVLRAARDAGVRRVVVTSSFAAVGYGHAATGRLLTEDGLDRPGGGGRAGLHAVEDAGGAGGLGVRRAGGRRGSSSRR